MPGHIRSPRALPLLLKEFKDFVKALEKLSGKQISDDAFAYLKKLVPIISELEANGITTDYAIAKELERRDIKTARGGKWRPTTVRNFRSRELPPEWGVW